MERKERISAVERKGNERKKKERSEKKKKERERTGRNGNTRVRGLSDVEGRGRKCAKLKCDGALWQSRS